MRFIILFLFSAVLLLTGCMTSKSAVTTPASNSPDTNLFKPPVGLRLVWSDEFNGPGIDLKNWSFETGETGWNMYWNNEYQTYTDNGTNGPNAFISNGCIVIRAERKERYNTFGSYRSARMSTENHRSWKYGVIAARIRMPYGNGMWPAFWMLGTDNRENTWPECGEIDIGEMAGGEYGKKIGGGDSVVWGSLHGPDYSGDTAKHANFSPTNAWPKTRLADDFHVYWVHWKPKEIVWYYDSVPYLKVRSSDVERWVFSHKFYIILNLAVGGNWPKYPDKTTVFPQDMTVDWVRVYQ
jgi:beta-glucanase (GH16 family)